MRAASLVPETSGYLALAVGDATSRLPFAIDPRLVLLTTEGNVGITKRGELLPPRHAARGLREILARLLAVSTGSAMPSLSAAARPREESDRGVDAVVDEIEAALIPVNRAAARRALARLARETIKARDSGRLRRPSARPPAEPPGAVATASQAVVIEPPAPPVALEPPAPPVVIEARALPIVAEPPAPPVDVRAARRRDGGRAARRGDDAAARRPARPDADRARDGSHGWVHPPRRGHRGASPRAEPGRARRRALPPPRSHGAAGVDRARPADRGSLARLRARPPRRPAARRAHAPLSLRDRAAAAGHAGDPGRRARAAPLAGAVRAAPAGHAAHARRRSAGPLRRLVRRRRPHARGRGLPAAHRRARRHPSPAGAPGAELPRASATRPARASGRAPRRPGAPGRRARHEAPRRHGGQPGPHPRGAARGRGRRRRGDALSPGF